MGARLSLSLTAAETRIARLKTGGLTGNPTPESAAGTFSFNLGDYTLFNWGKDYLRYTSDRASLTREMDILDEDARQLRHNVIEAYFRLVTLRQGRRIRQDQLKHAAFVYRFNRERATLKRISSEEYYRSRMEFFAHPGFLPKSAGRR